MKKAIIITEAGEGIGWGHLSRSLSLVQAFKQKKVPVKLLVHRQGSAKLPIPGSVQMATFDWKRDRARLFRELADCRIAVIDSYLGDLSLYKEIALRTELAVFIDDYQRLNYPPGVVINTAPSADRRSYPAKQNIEYLLGPSYALLRPEFWRRGRKKINKTIRSVMICCGGTDPLGLTSKISEILKEHEPHLEQVIVRGKASAVQMRLLMDRVDIAISAGGQTLFELATRGVPTISLCVARNQQQNIKGFAQLGFLSANVGASLERDIVRLLARIRSYEFRKRMSEQARRGVKSSGAMAVVETLTRHIKSKSTFSRKNLKLRPAQAHDCADIWRWRNAPLARKFSFQMEKIPYANHKQWFARKIQDPTVKMFLGEDQTGQKIGQVRFDQDNGATFIHVHLNPQFYGKGYGTALIEQSSRRFLNRASGAREIVAEIKEGNWPSIRAFQKAGFRFDSTLKKQDVETYRYKLLRDHV